MATERPWRPRLLVRVLVAAAVFAPTTLWLFGVGADALGPRPWVWSVGLGFAALAALLVRRFRGDADRPSDGSRPTDRSSEERPAPADEPEGSGEEYLRYVYNSRTEAVREDERVREEAQRLSEAARDAERR